MEKGTAHRNGAAVLRHGGIGHGVVLREACRDGGDAGFGYGPERGAVFSLKDGNGGIGRLQAVGPCGVGQHAHAGRALMAGRVVALYAYACRAQQVQQLLCLRVLSLPIEQIHGSASF